MAGLTYTIVFLIFLGPGVANRVTVTELVPSWDDVALELEAARESDAWTSIRVYEGSPVFPFGPAGRATVPPLLEEYRQ